MKQEQNPGYMACTGTGLIPPFPFWALVGQPPVEWEDWIASFTTYLDATGLSGLSALPDSRKRSVLVHCLGIERQQVFTSLDVTSDTYEAAMKSLGDHFGSHTNIAVGRFRFRQRQQQYIGNRFENMWHA